MPQDTLTDSPRDTREFIMETAEGLLFRQGFSGTSLNDVMKLAGMSKGAFFHHFKNKEALAHAVLERWADRDDDLVREFSARSQVLAEDPLQEAVIFIKLFEEWLLTLDTPLAGCLFASFTYESDRFDPAMRDYIKQRLGVWMDLYAGIFERLVDAREPRQPDLTGRDLTETLAALFEGGLLLSRALDDPHYLVRQLRQFRKQLLIMFE